MLLSHKARLSSPKLQQSSVSRSQIAPRRYQPSNVPRHVSFAASSDGQEEAAGGEGKDKGDKGKELGNVFQGDKRRRGRPAHLRSPYDTPLRDGNRDRLLGLLTERAARTLVYYLTETNLNVHHWLQNFIKTNPIPRDGHWSDVSGDTFLRTLLSMPIEEAKYDMGRDSLFDNTTGIGVDPRSIAQRIMEIRVQLAQEFVQDLSQVAEDNKILQLETLQASLLNTLNTTEAGDVLTNEAATNAAAANAAADAAAIAAASDDKDASGKGLTKGKAALAKDKEAQRARARSQEGAAREAAGVSRYKKKPVVLPPKSSPQNWRMKAEVELEVHGPENPAAPIMPDTLVRGQGQGPDAINRLAEDTAAPSTTSDSEAVSPEEQQLQPGSSSSSQQQQQQPPSSSSPPSSGGATLTPPSGIPVPATVGAATAGASSSSSSSSSSSASSSASSSQVVVPPLHPEVAEILPMLRTKPETLTADVASMLVTYAMGTGGKLHPDVSSALRDAMAAGAKLHPEIVELIKPVSVSAAAGSMFDRDMGNILNSDEE